MASDRSSDEDHSWKPSARRSKRIKTSSAQPARIDHARSSMSTSSKVSIDPLLEMTLVEIDFEEIFPKDDCLAARTKHLERISEPDSYGYRIRPLTPAEIRGLDSWLNSKAIGAIGWTNGDAILARRLQLHKLTQGSASVLGKDNPYKRFLMLPTLPPQHAPPNSDTISAIRSICRTSYECSFASRLKSGYRSPRERPHVIHRDTETRPPWVELLSDIRLHHYLSHPGCEPPDEVTAPIDYVSLQRSHLPQIHDLLGRTFWPGIDVSDSLQYSPTQCTIVSVYKRLVVGVAILSSPEETYLTYLVVRPGWENANIASIMLYHLITANPRKDITLHVSANNPAMLLYNKFGFKAEEFVVGFYEDYLAKESRACKNAFRLRLRR